MQPGFRPGDRLYVDPRPGRPLAVGDVVALRDPEAPDRLLLKRIARFVPAPGAGPGTARDLFLAVEGDNAPGSRDSRQFGPLPPTAVVGLAWYRYAPLDRAGPVPGEVF